MSHGNVKVLKETFESFKGVYDEIIYGDLLLFEEDRQIVKIYQKYYPLKIIPIEFNYIFKNGFASVLNHLATFANNDTVFYMNCSEVIDEDYGILDRQSEEYNCYYFIHRTDPHRWYRMYNRKEMQWGGRIHEELIGEHRPYPKPIFMMKDLEKDMDNPFKAAVFNSVKELCYFNQYIKIVDDPTLKSVTNDYWLSFAIDNYESMKYRMQKKGKQLEAFETGDFDMLLKEIEESDYFEKERFESSTLLNFQGARKDIL